MDIRIASINVGRVTEMLMGGKAVESAIDKRSKGHSIRVDVSGLDGDQQADHRYHGGPDQAVYLYSVQHYDWWSKRSVRRLRPGLFGENLTVDGMPDDLFVGDRLLIGEVILEVTGPRLPCSKLSEVMGDEHYARAFIEAERPGALYRVPNEGELNVGDTVNLVTGSKVSVRELFRLNYQSSPSTTDLERALAAPLAERLREKFSRRRRRAAKKGT